MNNVPTVVTKVEYPGEIVERAVRRQTPIVELGIPGVEGRIGVFCLWGDEDIVYRNDYFVVGIGHFLFPPSQEDLGLAAHVYGYMIPGPYDRPALFPEDETYPWNGYLMRSENGYTSFDLQGKRCATAHLDATVGIIASASDGSTLVTAKAIHAETSLETILRCAAMGSLLVNR